jgi:hypothetical protein
MNSERLIKIVMMDLVSDQMKLEDELEKTINSDMEINVKVITIKSLLSLMTAIDASITKFTSMTNNNNNNTD